MTSTYSPYLQIQLMATGDQSGTWGNTTNTNLGTIIEQAIAGNAAVSVISTNQALTVVNGATDQARMASVTLTTSLGSNFNIYAPPTPKIYVFFNNTSYVATIYNGTVANGTTAAGTGIAIPAGATTAIWSDGTNMSLQNNNVSLFTQGVLGYAYGGTGTTTSTGSGSNVLSASPAFTGAPTAPTPSVGTNNTQIATTAFVAAATGSLGTMASQNANAVAITGGSATGMTSLSATTVTANGNVVGSNSVGARTVSTSAPSGGSNGDIWYQV